mmetsp:Transcript_50574/g.99066  ORF Transcript_50574/g.99066 Transcript_50574/m.99066 type:complete len:533 (+) Transcript_50574:65-1663(+)|eukprot:CAMPEP_0175141286 /NCGR_PEP_ID=MMETSP0087-20121206/12022_1 /TAXON_ID=136419 /ORGANISM="Unknown Unknown, Strain D1" /LENGTH=532 /DNA_ID=CAMNT_0016424687 /DNA_START=42 /DNA_END=1640 /DNA_ORIENTATION=+
MSGIKPGDEVSGDWIRRVDPASGKTYYANFVTQASSWVVPPDWVEPAKSGPPPPGPPPPAGCPWKAVVDPTGRTYYFNPTTMETTWEKPEGFVEEPEPAASPGKKKPRPSILAYMPPKEDHSDDEKDEEEKDTATPLHERTASQFAFGEEGLNFDKMSLDTITLPKLDENSVAGGGVSTWDDSKKESTAKERATLVKLLVDDEKSYVKKLGVLAKDFGDLVQAQTARGEKSLHTVEHTRLIRNAPQLHEKHEKLWADVFDNLPAENADEELCDRMLKSGFDEGSWQGYGFYKASSEVAHKAFLLLKEREGVLEICQGCERLAQVNMDELLDLPNKRLKYYLQIFTKMAHTVDPVTQLMTKYRQVIDKLRAAEEDGHRSAVLKKARDRVGKIQKQLFFAKKSPTNLNLITPTRYHLIDGQFKKKFGSGGHLKASKQYWFFLFNDLLLYTTLPNKKGLCEPKYALPLMGAYVDTTQPEKMHIAIKSPIKDITMKAKSMEERDLWLNHLKNAIAKLAEEGNMRSGKPKQTTKRGW